ncbi:hypothetical protein MPH_11300 [Macrophomina phaseolina MS6]|uniref:Uncharacterized protein n=1 Tax=Macrophomina phaseolina (strain MS6) TaxID=1126212 RepID=K2RNL7_MACPH|nr:hypothetical protein MPH_11300 [Macrophomina phaseolina MS6]
MPDFTAFITSLMALAAEAVKHYLCLVAFASITLFDKLRTTSLALSYYAQEWYDTHGFQSYTAAVHRQLPQYQSFLAATHCLPQQWRSFTNELWIRLLAVAVSVGDKTTNMWLTSAAPVIHAVSCASSYMWRRAMVAMVGIVNAGHKALDFCNAIPTWTRLEFRFAMGSASTFWRLLGNLYTRTKAFKARSWRDKGQWLLQTATAVHAKAALARSFALESKEELIHYYRSTGPWVVKTFWVLYLLTLLVYFRGHVSLVQYAASPLNQLQSMRLEMTLRKSMPGAYAYDHEISSRSPHCFRSTLQLYAFVSPATKIPLNAPTHN